MSSCISALKNAILILPFFLSSFLPFFLSSFHLMNLPEIQLQVGALLSRHDLTSCVLVCRLWHASFTPFLYSQANNDYDVYPPQWPLFRDKLHHVRDLTLALNFVRSVKDQNRILEHCQNLIHLKIQSFSGRDTEFFVKLLERNRQLTSVAFSMKEFEGMGTSNAAMLLRTMAISCPRLMDLRLDVALLSTSVKEFYGLFSTHFMSRLTKLEWTWTQPHNLPILPWMVEPTDDEEDKAGSYSGNCRPIFPLLRELTVCSIVSSILSEHSWESELVLFKRCPVLESLSWTLELQPRERSMQFGKALRRMLNNNYRDLDDLDKNQSGDSIGSAWPRLKFIRLSQNNPDFDCFFSDGEIADVLKDCPNPLSRIELPQGCRHGLFTWHAMRRHFGSLQVLHLSKPMEETTTVGMTNVVDRSRGIVQILAQCPLLVELRCLWSSLDLREVVQEMDLDLEDYMALLFLKRESLTTDSVLSLDSPPRPRFPWVCHRLRVLHVALRIGADPHPIDQYRMFAQLIQLTELQELHLCLPGVKADYGLDPRESLGVKEAHSQFAGHFRNTTQIRKHTMGRKILELWPQMTNCYWINER